MSQIRVPFVNLGLEYELVRQPILEAIGFHLKGLTLWHLI